MKSTIKIEFDYDRKEPYIEVKLQDTDDMRDRMLKSFFQQNGAGVTKLRLHYTYINENDPVNRIIVANITNDLKDQ